ncbi:MAG: carbohydrate ABC transporter permease [Tyzzerella sp.]|nr:carbohydrate ABC transporter permease [Tyzzerella sp.]
MRKNKIKTPVGAKIICVFLVIYASAILYPYLLALNSAFRDWGSFTDNIFGVSKWTLDNFKQVFVQFNYPVTMPDGTPGAFYFDGLLFNSALYSLGCAAAASICPCIVGYCTAKFPYKFSRFIISMIYVLMGLPIVGTTVSEIQMSQTIGIYNTIPGMWFLKFGFVGLYTLLFHSMYKSLPNEYVEAAYMDGAGNMQIFTRIMVPMGMPTMSVVFILSFVNFWSDYTTPMYFLPSYPTLSLSLLNFAELSSTTETMQMAACVLLCIPSLVLFACFTEKFTENLQVGGIKG